MLNGQWTDLISDFMNLTEGVISPPIFRQWAAIGLVSGALERRVWLKAGDKTTFANLYVLLVGPPGTGKQIIEEVRGLWTEIIEPGTSLPALHVAPDNMTKASLMDTLVKSRTARPGTRAGDPPLVYHSLLVAAEEFGVLLPDYDMAYIHSLNAIYNNKASHSEVRRTGTVRDLKIENPQIIMLGGVQPSYLANTFPEDAWSTGFARRLIMVYSAEPPEQDLFFQAQVPEGARERLLAHLARLATLQGSFQFEPEAVEALRSWDKTKGPPTPTHSKLVHYIRSRTLHLLKLSMVAAASARAELVIRLGDVERASAWLHGAEALMPDIFREMIGKSDTQVIEELHHFATAIWAKGKAKPVHSSLLWNFLRQRVPSEKIERIMAVAERSNILARVAGTTDLWIPRPSSEHGME